MADLQTYVPIATQTLGTAASSITFSSIPNTYTDLVLIASTANSTNTDTWIRFNSDTTTNYSSTYLRGDGSSAYSGRRTNINRILIEENGTGTGQAVTRIQIQNYANASIYKTALSRSDAASNGASEIVGLWRNAAAISTIDVGADSGTFSVGSTFTLYGIKAA